MENKMLRKADAMLQELDKKISLGLQAVEDYQEQKVCLLEFKRMYREVERSDTSIPLPASKIPKISEMVRMVLSGRPELTSGDILEAIHVGWKPDLARESLSPALTRMKKAGILRLDGRLWCLAEANQEAGNPGTEDEDQSGSNNNSPVTEINGDNFVMH